MGFLHSLFDSYKWIVFTLAILSAVAGLLGIALKILDSRRHSTLAGPIIDSSVFDLLFWDDAHQVFDDEDDDDEDDIEKKLEKSSKNNDNNQQLTQYSIATITDASTAAAFDDARSDSDARSNSEDSGFVLNDNTTLDPRWTNAFTPLELQQLREHYDRVTQQAPLDQTRFAQMLDDSIDTDVARQLFVVMGESDGQSLSFGSVVNALLLLNGFLGLPKTLAFYFQLAHPQHRRAVPVDSDIVATALQMLLHDQSDSPDFSQLGIIVYFNLFYFKFYFFIVIFCRND